LTLSRKLWLYVGGVTTLALLVLLAWVWWIPHIVSTRAADTIAERFGLRVTIHSSRVQVSNVVIEGIRVESPVGQALDARISAVRLHTGFLGWLWQGSASVDQVDVEGMLAHVSMASEAEREEWARLRTTMRSRGSSSSGGAGREFAIHDASVTLRDARGELLRVVAASVERADGVTTLHAAEVGLGAAPFDALTMRDVRVRLAREGESTVLEELRVQDADARWIRREVQNERDDNTMVRLLDVAHSFGANRTDGAGAARSRSAGVRSRAIGLLGEHGAVHVARLNVTLHSEQRDEVILRNLRADAEARAGHVVRTSGQGAASDHGTVHWDLTIAPEDLRAEGSVSFEALPLALVTPFLPDVPWYEPEASELDGDLILRASGDSRVSIEGNVHVSNAGIFSARIAPNPVRNISFTIGGRGVFNSAARRLEITSSRIDIGTANATLVGTVEWASDHYLFDLRASMPETPCGAAIGAIPRDLLADAATFSWSGAMSAQARVWVDSRALTGTQVEVSVSDGCQFETVPSLADLARFDAPFLHQVLEPDGTVFQMETGPGTPAWTPISRISPFLVHSVLAHEDAGFFRHHGFAPAEFQIALARNLEAHRYVQGASTITMQLVKNVFLRREKTLARKAQELLLTWWIERTWDKARILELYLNVIEYGPSIYGIRSASQHYFGCEPSELTPAQSSFLANILPNPKVFHPMYENAALTPHFAERMRLLLRRMQTRGRIDQAALDDGLDEIAQFAFHREGDAAAALRPLVGVASELPLNGGGAPIPWEDDPAVGTEPAAFEPPDYDPSANAPGEDDADPQ
jgi:hypothetical protein